MIHSTPSIRSRALAGLALCLVPTAPLPAQHAVALTEQAPRSLAGVRFRFAADGAVRGGFGLAGSTLLFGTEAGSLYAIDAQTGRLKWRRALGSPILSTPAIDAECAYLTTWDNALHAIDAATGRELWRRDLGRTLGPNDYWEYYVSSPVEAGGRLYVGSASGRVVEIETASGRITWSADLGARVRTTPLIAGDKVIVGTMSGQVVALDRRNGQRLWSFATIGAAHDYAFKHNDTRSVVTEPIVVRDTVIAGGRDGNIYGVDLATGRERWRETHDGGSWILGLVSDGQRFYSGSGSAFIMQAADPATGKEIWRSPTGGAMFGGVALAGAVAVSNSSTGNLLGFDARSGARLWRFRLPDLTLSSPLVADGVIYTGSDDGSVYAIDTRGAEAAKLDRYVFSYTNEPDQSAFWFRPETVAAVRGAFLTSGYAALGNADLAAALAKPMTDKGRKIIVIADQRFPEGIDGALLRAFVDGGGVLVLTALDPLNYQFDEAGSPTKIDEEKEKAAFGLDPPDRERDNGYNVSTYSAAGRLLGLNGWFAAQQWARPDQVSTVLATDRANMATAWIKTFGKGGMLIRLPVPRFRTVDLSPYVNAVELAGRVKP
jgi:outer membrane protein assembly factor BamB